MEVEPPRLTKNGKPLVLTHKAFQTLLILVQKSEQVVEKDEIISLLWTDTIVEESNLSQHIYTLRKTLGKDAKGNPYIETITKRGFRFTKPVTKILFEPKFYQDIPDQLKKEIVEGSNLFSLSPDIDLSDPPHKFNNENITQSFAREKVLRYVQSINFKIVLSLLILILLIFFFPKLMSPPPEPIEISQIKSIAILPLQTISSENGYQKLGFGITDSIINQLSKLKIIPVRSSSAVFPYVDQPIPNPASAGKELGVDAILVGTVQKEGDRVRVSVQLFNVADEKILWAESYHENSIDFFTIQDTISAKVAQALAIKLTSEQEQLLAQKATKNRQAFEAYEQGVYFWNKRSKVDLQNAVICFQNAINLDSDYARAYAGLADTYNLLGYYRFEKYEEMNIKSRTAAQKALALDKSLPEAYMALAFTQDDLSQTEYLLEKAINLSPYNSTIQVRYAWFLLSRGNLEQAVLHAKLAQEYDPLSNVSNNVACGFLSFQNKYEEAIPFCEKAVSIASAAPRNRLVLAKVYFLNGRHEDSLLQLKTQINLENENDVNEASALLCYFYVKMNRYTEAVEILPKLKSKSEKDPNLFNYLILINHSLGKIDEALFCYKKARQLNSFDSIRFRYDPIWEEIRKDKRFSE